MIALRILVTAGLVAIPAFAFAAELPLSPRRAIPATTMHDYGKSDPQCSSWSDGCRICRRGEGEGAAAVCSNVGIACQAGAVTCTARQ